MNYNQVVRELLESIEENNKDFQSQLILNPVENIPIESILTPATSYLHGIYNSDKIRNNDQKKLTKIQFSKRDFISNDISKIYKMWGELLGAESVSMRLLSGLHAHIVIFMAITDIGDTVMLLPESAGGHMATKTILERLGLNVCEFAVDFTNYRIDKNRSIEIIKSCNPKIIFFDRSEGLLYEDLSWLSEFNEAYKIFDSSQYLTNIIAGDYISPFNMGFDAIISTLHKNIPGPQRALFCSKKKDHYWERFYNRVGTYVSNMHVFSIYSAGLLLGQYDSLIKLSSEMLSNTLYLDSYLSNENLPVVNREMSPNEPNTHHIWLKCDCKDDAFRFYLNMESVGLAVNYRLLPYNLRYGIRMGLSAATYSGISSENINQLGYYIKRVYDGKHSNLKKEISSFILNVKEKNTLRKFNV